MPKKNPKHAKKAFYERKKQYETRKLPIKYIAMGFIFVISITGVVLLAIFLPDSTNDNGDKLYVEDGDNVVVHYKLWMVADIGDLDKSVSSGDDFQEGENFETIVTKEALYNGFYYELLGREIGEAYEFAIDKETDANGDGFDDDNPDEEILGKPDSNKIYYFWVQILEIVKSEDNLPSSSLDNIEFTVQMENFSENYLQCNVRKLFSFEFLENY